MELPPYVILDKAVGETPLSCAEAWRAQADVSTDVPLAYAGRLDPMASGKLLVLIGDECKNQTNYHSLDKGYDFSVLIGMGSDTHDVLGRLTADASVPEVTKEDLEEITASLTGEIELPYPHFSAKTVQGKPLHMWTLEDRLDEIEIPTKQSTIYNLDLTSIETKSRAEVADEARAKIDTIPEVTETRKALGNDFRRVDVRKDWEQIKNNNTLPDTYQIAHLHCIATSGTYMRTLAHLIGQRFDTKGLAWHIHRTIVGAYDPNEQTWSKEF